MIWFKRLLLLCGIAVAIGAGTAYFAAQRYLHSKPSPRHEERVVTIPQGASVGLIARTLADAGVLTHPRYFRAYIRYTGLGGRLKAGEFRFYTDMTPPEVLQSLLEGREVLYSITFPEGYNIREMAPLVDDLPFLKGDRFRTLAESSDLAREYGIDAPTLEGFLFPSTYQLPRSASERTLIAAMVREFKKHWTPRFEARAQELGMSRLEIVTLASVIEKETGHPDERPTVSSVFHNRLKRGMKLQSDPTIIYGLKNFDGNIRKKDILAPHPWNTYVIPGLPPSPIANPGLASLEAALWPAQTDYLYFVARGDRRHSFSKTYQEHARKVLEYQIKPHRRR